MTDIQKRETRYLLHQQTSFINRYVCLVVLLLMVLSSSVGWADEAADDYLAAAKLYSKGRYELAADSFQSFIKKNPKHSKVAVAQLYLGNALVRLDQRKKARAVLRKFVGQFPTNKNRADALYRIAECSYFIKDYSAAEKEFQRFLKKAPTHEFIEWALPYLGDTQIRLNHPKQAAIQFQKSLKKFPRGRMAEDSKFGLAKSYEMLKQIKKAIKLYQELATRSQGERAPQAQVNLATIYFDQKKYNDAIAAYQLLIKRFPKNDLVPFAHLNIGYAWYQQKKYTKAIQAFKQAAQKKEQAPVANYWMGLSYKSTGRFSVAAKVLKKLYEADSKTPLAKETLYQWADCELRQEHYKKAKELFLKVVSKYPKTEAAAASLHMAGEAAFLLEKTDEAEKLVNQFTRNYPESAMRMHHQILNARVLNAKGGKENLSQAIQLFESVIQQSTISRTRFLARYHLTSLLQRSKKDKQAIVTVTPLTNQAKKEGADYEFVDAFVLAGNSFLNLKKYKEANGMMAEYLSRLPKGALADQALSTRAIAEAEQGEKETAHSLLSKLISDFPKSKWGVSTLRLIAERAYGNKDFAWSTQLFSQLIDKGTKTTFHPAALSGLAWSQFGEKKYEEAAKTFALFVKQYPDNKQLAPEAAFMQGRSYKEARRIDSAATAFSDAFKKYAPKKAASPQAEQKPPLRYVYLAGLQAARMYRNQKKTKEANAAYNLLLEKFPQAESLDKLLDEWALLNYGAENFEQADKIFRRLIQERPQSDLADNALLSLAESDLLAGKLAAAKASFIKLKTDKRADAVVREVAMSHLVSIATEEQKWEDVRDNAKLFLKHFSKSHRADYVQFQYAEALLHFQDYAEAKKILIVLYARRKALLEKKNVWFPRVWVLLAEIAIKNKEYDDVVKYVEELRAQEDRPTYFYQAEEILGRMHIRKKEFAKAQKVLQRVLDDKNARRTETAAKSQFFIAECYLYQKKKDYKNAQKAYFKVYSLYNSTEWQSAALFQVGQCDEALGNRKKAIESYQDLIKEFPKSKFVSKAKKRLVAIAQ